MGHPHARKPAAYAENAYSSYGFSFISYGSSFLQRELASRGPGCGASIVSRAIEYGSPHSLLRHALIFMLLNLSQIMDHAQPNSLKHHESF